MAPFSYIRRHPGLLVVLFILLSVVYFINPVREMAKDDDWAYALTVKHLLETGQYQLHDWASANMPIQIYLGAIFSKVLGYSFSTLRLSTLVMLFTCLIAFYYLLRDFGSGDIKAGILTLALMSSPLVLLFAFSFMTCIHFLAWFIIALWLYTRAIRQYDVIIMLLASIFASFAILTRQFAIAIPIGLFFFAIFDRKNATFYAIGFILPALAGIWQICYGIFNPTIYMAANIDREILFLSDFPRFVTEYFWRISVVFQYMILFLLSLSPLYVLLVSKIKKSLFWMGFVIAGIGYGYIIRGVLMPSIGYNLASSINRISFLPIPLTIITGIGAVILGWIVLARYASRRVISQDEKFLAFSFLILLVMHLIYVQFLDEYLIIFIPFAIFIIAQETGHLTKCYKILTALFCFIALAASSLWIYVLLDRKEAFWSAAEAIHATGVPAEEIYAGEWSYYHAKNTEDIFKEFSPAIIDKAKYLISDPYFLPYNAAQKEEWAIVDKVGYKWFNLKNRYGFIFKRKE